MTNGKTLPIRPVFEVRQELDIVKKGRETLIRKGKDTSVFDHVIRNCQAELTILERNPDAYLDYAAGELMEIFCK